MAWSPTRPFSLAAHGGLDLRLHNSDPVRPPSLDADGVRPRRCSADNMSCASVNGDCRCRLITPMGRVALRHCSYGMCCTAPGGTSLMIISFITQSNHRFACSSRWKSGFGCSRFSLTRVLRLPLCVYVVLRVACLMVLLWRVVFRE